MGYLIISRIFSDKFDCQLLMGKSFVLEIADIQRVTHFTGEDCIPHLN